MSCKNGVTHHTGCECHEQAWIDRLDLGRQEILKLREVIAELDAEKRRAYEKQDLILENDMLRRIIAKELTENDELGSEFVYAQALKEQLQKACQALDWCSRALEAMGAKNRYLIEIIEEIRGVLK